MLFLHALLLSALFLAGCVREEFPGSGSVAEGKPSQVAFNLIVPAMSSSPSTRAMTPEEERKIENLRVMVFRADGSVVSNDKYAGTGNQFTVNSYSGSNYTLLFIANVNSAEIEARLQSAASLSDMEQFVTTATQLDFGLNTTPSPDDDGKAGERDLRSGQQHLRHSYSASFHCRQSDGEGDRQKHPPTRG